MALVHLNDLLNQGKAKAVNVVVARLRQKVSYIVTEAIIIKALGQEELNRKLKLIKVKLITPILKN